jgi:hypothetical protein
VLLPAPSLTPFNRCAGDVHHGPRAVVPCPSALGDVACASHVCRDSVQ